MSSVEFKLDAKPATSTVKASKPKLSFEQPISVNQFASDLKLRFPKEFNSTKQTWVYFYTEDDVYNFEYNKTKNNETIHRDYIIFRPARIAFVKLNEKTHQLDIKCKVGDDIDVYTINGIKFETHMTNKFDKTKYRTDREIDTESQFNVIKISNELQTFDKPQTAWDFEAQSILYYKWRTAKPDKSAAPIVKYISENVDRAESFVPEHIAIDEPDKNEVKSNITFS